MLGFPTPDVKQGSATIANGPDTALFSKSRCFGAQPTPICPYVVYSCLFSKLSSCNRNCMPTKPKILILWPFIHKVCLCMIEKAKGLDQTCAKSVTYVSACMQHPVKPWKLSLCQLPQCQLICTNCGKYPGDSGLW